MRAAAQERERGATGGAAQGPRSEHDVRLLHHVAPPDWRNPRAAGRYHLAVVGAGTGGLVSAAIAAALGARVALIERHRMGGDCLNVGCVPSKALLAAAHAWATAAGAAPEFHGPAATGDGDFAAVMERMRRLRADLSPVDSAERFRQLGVDVFFGEARFVGADALAVGGQRLRFQRAVIATGSQPRVPEVPGLAEAGYLTNENVFELRRRPARLAILGGGAIGCELAQAFARLGCRVTLLEAAPCILPNADADAARLLASVLRHDGVRLVTEAEVRAVLRHGQTRVLRYARRGVSSQVVADELLVAVGRVPQVEGLGLQAAGVRYGPAGVEVDEELRTSNPHVFAVGDVVAGRPHYTHAADAQARLVVQNALFFGHRRASELVIPSVVYTRPEVAHVGLAPDEARRQAGRVQTITVPFADVDRARLEGDESGFLRVHLRAGSDEVLGATVVGEHAGELIAPLALAMTAGLGLDALGRTVFPYPTRAEILRKAADAWRRAKLTPLAKSALGLYFRLRG